MPEPEAGQLISRISQENGPGVIDPRPDRQGRNYANFVCSAPAAGFWKVRSRIEGTTYLE